MSKKILLNYNNSSQAEKKVIQALDAETVGQSRAKKRLVRLLMYANSKGGRLRDKDKPAGIIWLLGPSGVGKSHIAHALAKIIFGDPMALTQIDCTQYTERHDISGLIGTKPGYIGFDIEPLLSQSNLDRWGFELDLRKKQDKVKIFNKLSHKLNEIAKNIKNLSKEVDEPTTLPLRKKEIKEELTRLRKAGDQFEKEYDEIEPEISYNPGAYPSILLFDEIEKAHRSLHNILYRIFQEGLITTHFQDKNRGTNTAEVSFRNTFIILTANVGEEFIKKLTEGRMPGFTNQLSSKHKDIYNRVMKELEKIFPAPFIRRIGKENMIICDVLSRSDLEEALDRLLIPQLLAVYKKTMPISLTLTRTLKEYLIDEAYDIKSRSLGYSALQNVFKKHISEPLSILASKSLEENGITIGDILIADLVTQKNGLKKVSFFREELPNYESDDLPIVTEYRGMVCTFDII